MGTHSGLTNNIRKRADAGASTPPRCFPPCDACVRSLKSQWDTWMRNERKREQVRYAGVAKTNSQSEVVVRVGMSLADLWESLRGSKVHKGQQT